MTAPRVPALRAPRTWPENAWPTAEEWRDWFLACSTEAQLELAEVVLNDAQRATSCFMRRCPIDSDSFTESAAGPTA